MNKGFFDNDILIKLAGCSLIEKTCQQLEIEKTWILPSLKVQLDRPKNSGALAKRFATFPTETKDRVLKYINQCSKLSPSKDSSFVERYISEQNLHTGELQLLEASFNEGSSFLITGDRRFLRGVIEHPELCEMALDKLPHRFVCLESILLLLINKLGFNFISERVLPFREHDGQIKIAFGQGRAGTEERARESLCNALRELGDKAERLLHYYPL